jgi:hypothetical protein
MCNTVNRGIRNIFAHGMILFFCGVISQRLSKDRLSKGHPPVLTAGGERAGHMVYVDRT